MSILTGLICSHSLHAVEWSIEPSLDVSSNYNDNIWISPSDKNQTLDVRFKPAVMLNRESENNLLSLTTGWMQKKYISDDNDPDGLFNADLNFNQQLESQVVKLNIGYADTSTATSEPGESGRVLVEAIKTEKKLSPTWQISLSPKMLVDVNFYFLKINFDASDKQWFDFRYSAPSVSGRYELNDTTNVNASIGATRYELDDIDYRVDSYFFQTGLNHEISDNSKAGVMLGVQDITSELQQGTGINKQSFKDNSQQVTARIDYAVEFEKSNINLAINRSLVPTSQGESQFTNRLEVGGKYFWTEGWSTLLGLTGENRENVGSNKTISSQETLSTSIRVDWQVEEQWRVHLTYRWYVTKYQYYDEWISNNQLVLSTNFTWDKTVFQH